MQIPRTFSKKQLFSDNLPKKTMETTQKHHFLPDGAGLLPIHAFYFPRKSKIMTKMSKKSALLPGLHNCGTTPAQLSAQHQHNYQHNISTTSMWLDILHNYQHNTSPTSAQVPCFFCLAQLQHNSSTSSADTQILSTLLLVLRARVVLPSG